MPAWMAGCSAARKPCAGEVHGSPIVVHRADLAAEGGTEGVQYAVGLDPLAPKQLDGRCVIGVVDAVLGEGNGGNHLHWNGPDGGFKSQPCRCGHGVPIEFRRRLGVKADACHRAIAGPDGQAVVEEVEFHVEGVGRVGDGVRRQAAGRHIEQHLPLQWLNIGAAPCGPCRRSASTAAGCPGSPASPRHAVAARISFPCSPEPSCGLLRP